MTKLLQFDLLQFDGTNTYVDVPGLKSPSNNGGAITVEFWNYVKSEDVRQSFAFGFWTDDFHIRTSCHAPWGDKSLYWDCGDWTKDGRLPVDYKNYLDKWTHIALVSAGANAENPYMAIYLNGKLVAEKHKSDSPSKPLEGLRIGGHKETGLSSSYIHRGMIDQFRVWNRVLTQEEIQRGMLADMKGDEPNLVACFNSAPLSNATVWSNCVSGSPNGQLQNFSADNWVTASVESDMLIPVQGNHVQITGDAVKNEPHDILFDTGSWVTCLPESWVDPDKTTLLRDGAKFTGPWENYCQLVVGQLTLMGEDGKTKYSVDEFVFFKILEKKENGEDQQGRIIMGAFPSPDPSRSTYSIPKDPEDPKHPEKYKSPMSFPYALAKKYPGDYGLGFGFVSQAPTAADGSLLNVGEGWATLKLYLQLGADPVTTRHLHWRSDIPLWHEDLDFCPEAVPGFKIRVSVPGTEPDTEQVINAPAYAAKTETDPESYMATIDTGAPDLTLRLGDTDPHLQPSFAAYFTQNGPSWWEDGIYEAHAKSLENGKVTIQFTDSNGVTQEYTFEAKGYQHQPATLFAGKWDGDVPWVVSLPSFPRNRINLGNTVYYYCPVFFYDIANKRVGIRFR